MVNLTCIFIQQTRRSRPIFTEKNKKMLVFIQNSIYRIIYIGRKKLLLRNVILLNIHIYEKRICIRILIVIYYFRLHSSSAKLAFISIKVISNFILYNKKERGEIDNYHNSKVIKDKSGQKLYSDVFFCNGDSHHTLTCTCTTHPLIFFFFQLRMLFIFPWSVS